MEVNLPQGEKLGPESISASPGGSVADYFCQCQELRTNLEPGAVSCIGIDEETDAVVLESELDCTPGRCEIVRFSDYQDTLAAKLDQDLGQMAALGSSDEQDLATDDVRHALYSRDTDRMPGNEFSS
jgi:hypothetical protein